MTIAREEIFGPVLSILSYRDDDEAVRIANDTDYGLAAYVSSADLEHARAVAARLRAGTVSLNYPAWDVRAPFGGFKQLGQRARIRRIRHRRISRVEGGRRLPLSPVPRPFWPLCRLCAVAKAG